MKKNNNDEQIQILKNKLKKTEKLLKIEKEKNKQWRVLISEITEEINDHIKADEDSND
ncbi:hypothetical protein [Lactococcus lactis]|uniref:Uncharacterized protein n=1 Tax=Lactococcus lactis TaxID=1358 RepID=A0AB35KE71_9LACT|nr:hypothetical protein [Lactococcus lactis]MDG5049545.1 hypothetical protein [Lactococcus lactis]